MRLAEQTRHEVARFVWSTNPHSVSLAASAIGFAELIDALRASVWAKTLKALSGQGSAAG
jgi:hypothetical protein